VYPKAIATRRCDKDGTEGSPGASMARDKLHETGQPYHCEFNGLPLADYSNCRAYRAASSQQRLAGLRQLALDVLIVEQPVVDSCKVK